MVQYKKQQQSTSELVPEGGKDRAVTKQNVMRVKKGSVQHNKKSGGGRDLNSSRGS